MEQFENKKKVLDDPDFASAIKQAQAFGLVRDEDVVRHINKLAKEQLKPFIGQDGFHSDDFDRR